VRKLLGALSCSLALAATLLPAPSATAADGDLWPAPFEYCPVGVVTNPETGATTTTCVSAVGTGGTFKLGKTEVTLTSGVRLQGGLGTRPEGPGFIEANDGMTLTGPDQAVPGGVLGIAVIQDLLPGITNIAAEVRLVGLPEMVLGRDLEMTLPLQVRLKNLLLGPNCHIGSAEEPILLHLTSGTTSPPEGVEPMTGTPGEILQPPLGALVLEFKGQTLVDNTFAVPRAQGCGALGLLNKVVDLRSGLPAAPGASYARLVTNTFVVAAADAPNVSGYEPGM